MINHTRKPNIVLIVADCLRQDYAYDPEIMPFLNSFKDQNWYSTNAYTNATETSFAVPTLLAGFIPFEIINKPGIHNEHLVRYLPKILKDQGYTTIGITGNVVTSKYFNFHQGFDYFQDFLHSHKRQDKISDILKKIVQKIPKSIKSIPLYKQLVKIFKEKEIIKDQNINIAQKVRGDIILDELKSLDIKKESNFVFLHFMEPHSPYAPLEYCSTKQDLKKIRDTINLLYSNLYSNSSDLGYENIVFLKKDVQKRDRGFG